MSWGQALHAIQRFGCITDRCEDTCCAGLRVSFDAPTLAQLRALYRWTPEQQDEVIELVSEAGPVDVASFRPRADGSCHLLGPTGLCTVHRDHGVDALPDICATFPRVVQRRPDGTLEVKGSMACPEYARHVLLGDDALAWSDSGPELMPRAPPTDVPVLSDEDLALREAACAVLACAEVPLSSRLIALAHLAVEQDPQVIARFAEVRLRGIHRNYEALEVPGEKVAALLLRVLEVRLRSSHGDRFARFIVGVRSALSRAGAGTASTPADAYAAYRAARRTLAPLHDAALSRYATHQWLRHAVSDAPSPLHYAARLALRMAQASWYLTLHAASAEGRAQRHDVAIVHALHQVAKQLEGHPDFKEAVTTSLDCPPDDLLTRAVVFAKFL